MPVYARVILYMPIYAVVLVASCMWAMVYESVYAPHCIYACVILYMPVSFCICPYMRWQWFRPVCGPWWMSLYMRLTVYMLV